MNFLDYSPLAWSSICSSLSSDCSFARSKQKTVGILCPILNKAIVSFSDHRKVFNSTEKVFLVCVFCVSVWDFWKVPENQWNTWCLTKGQRSLYFLPLPSAVILLPYLQACPVMFSWLIIKCYWSLKANTVSLIY